MPVNRNQVHETVVQPYIEILSKNIAKRFGDSAGKVSMAAGVFDPSNVGKTSLKEQQTNVRLLSEFFKLDADDGETEWTCFRNYLQRHQSQLRSEVLEKLLTSEVGDSYPVLSKLAGILLSCPVGTAGKKQNHYITVLYY